MHRLVSADFFTHTRTMFGENFSLMKDLVADVADIFVMKLSAYYVR